ncbi:MAG: DUF5118 domain-containing protein, partial [Roseateles sp.]
MMKPMDKSGLTLVATAALILLSGCASTTADNKAATAAPAATGGAKPAAAPAPAATQAGSAAAAPQAARPPADPTAPKPFAEIIKDAKQQNGLFPIWRKDEKVWLEIPKAM